MILPSWDKILPLFVQAPTVEGHETLYHRLQKWVAPTFLRPLPYRLPPSPLFAADKVAVFRVTPPQDDALALSWLAEYFVEMGRPEPADLVARVLAQSYSQDPNALLARASVSHALSRPDELSQVLSRISEDVTQGRTPSPWDRWVQRAIVLALARQPELARRDAAACVHAATADDVRELTPLQAHRLQLLMKRLRLTFSDPDCAETLRVLASLHVPDTRDRGN